MKGMKAKKETIILNEIRREIKRLSKEIEGIKGGLWPAVPTDTSHWFRDKSISLVTGTSITSIKPIFEALTDKPEGLIINDILARGTRSRSTEVNYLNRLFHSGIVKKERKGKRVVYKLTPIGEDVAHTILST